MTKNEIFIEKSKIIHLDKYDYSNTNYINNYSKVEIICKEHGSFLQKPLYHKNHGCPKCGILNMKYKKVDNENNWLKDFIKIHNNKYDYSKVIYINSKDKVEIICKEHGSFFQRVIDHKKGRGCKKCGILNAKRFKNNIIDDFIIIHNDKYDYSKVEYIDTKTKVEIICKKHGSFFQRPSQHRKGSDCPSCKCSKGEKIIINFLKDNNIQYEIQYKFNDCLSISLHKRLSFDFYLHDYNTCIEYDGIQHFIPIDKWGGINRFKNQVSNDNIKNNYCINKNIKLIRIPYTNINNIYEILSFILKTKKS